MRVEIGNLDPLLQIAGTGALGRMADALVYKGFSVNAFGIDTDMVSLQSRFNNITKREVASENGFPSFNPSADSTDILREGMLQLNKESELYNNLYTESFSDAMVSS